MKEAQPVEQLQPLAESTSWRDAVVWIGVRVMVNVTAPLYLYVRQQYARTTVFSARRSVWWLSMTILMSMALLSVHLTLSKGVPGRCWRPSFRSAERKCFFHGSSRCSMRTSIFTGSPTALFAIWWRMGFFGVRHGHSALAEPSS